MKHILIEDVDNVRIVTLNRPKALNALNGEMIQEVGSAIDEVYSNQGIFGVVLTGSGDKAFAAGADIKGFPDLTQEDAYKLSQEGHEVFNQIENFNKPVIAAVNGYALGGGLELAMACHMRVGDSKSMFGLPEVKLGLIPGYGGTQRLPVLIGKAKAMEYILTANMMDAETALKLGLINHLVKEGEAVAKALEIIKTIGKRGPLAIKEAIRLVNLSGNNAETAFQTENQSFAELMASDQCKEGVNAFIEKRNPKFRN